MSFDGRNVFSSAHKTSYLFILIVQYISMYYTVLCDCIGWGIPSIFFPLGFLAFKCQATHTYQKHFRLVLVW